MVHYVCMYVCMYVCSMYVQYVCMYVCDGRAICMELCDDITVIFSWDQEYAYKC